MADQDRPNYYAVLGVPRQADARAIKDAYRRLAQEHHPDKGGDPERFRVLNEAYEVLSESGRRQRYDRGDDPLRFGAHAAHEAAATVFRRRVRDELRVKPSAGTGGAT